MLFRLAGEWHCKCRENLGFPIPLSLSDYHFTQLAARLLDLSKHFLALLLEKICLIRRERVALPSHLMSRPVYPTAIFPIMTTQPRSLSAFLLKQGMNARPITWPTVPKGKDRVRVCLHAGNTKEEVEKLVDAIVTWAETEKTRVRL
jgi:8-amino-7-oxononanoate synthase